MEILSNDLEKMEKLLEAGSNIAAIAREFPNYSYSIIYSQMNNGSLRGKKKYITGKLNKLKNTATKADRDKIIDDVQSFVNDMYAQAKRNCEKISSILKTLDR